MKVQVGVWYEDAESEKSEAFPVSKVRGTRLVLFGLFYLVADAVLLLP